MSQQIIIGRTNSSASDDVINQPFCLSNWQHESLSARIAVTMMAACTVSKLYVKCAAAPGSGKSYTFTLYKNGSSTAMTFSIADLATEGSNIANPITFAAGDTMFLRRDASGSPTASIMTVITQIDCTNAVDSVYGFQNWQTAPDQFGTKYQGVFVGRPSNWASTVTDYQSLVAAAGNLTGYGVRLSAAPGAGTSYNYAIYKNGTKQDGTGGTVDTTLSVADAATSGSVNFTLPVVAGDRLAIECDPTGATVQAYTTGGFSFAATTPGQSNYVCIRDGGAVTLAATSFSFPYGYNTTGDTTEANVDAEAGFVPFQLSGLQVRQNAVSGAGKSWQYKGRLNLGNPQHQLDVTISGDTDVSGSDTNPSHKLTLTAASDTFDIETTPTSTPNNSAAWWSMIQSPVSQGQGAKGGGKNKGGGGVNIITTGGATMVSNNIGLDISGTN